MTEENEKIKQWKYDFAWKQLENSQLGNERLDNKAMSIINFSSLIIPIVTGILFFALNKTMIPFVFYISNIGASLLLIGSMFFAFKVIWLRDQGIIETKDQFSAIGNDEIEKILGNTAEDLSEWQSKIITAGFDKGYYLGISTKLFILALVLISLSAGLLLFSFFIFLVYTGFLKFLQMIHWF